MAEFDHSGKEFKNTEENSETSKDLSQNLDGSENSENDFGPKLSLERDKVEKCGMSAQSSGSQFDSSIIISDETVDITDRNGKRKVGDVCVNDKEDSSKKRKSKSEEKEGSKYGSIEVVSTNSRVESGKELGIEKQGESSGTSVNEIVDVSCNNVKKQLKEKKSDKEIKRKPKSENSNSKKNGTKMRKFSLKSKKEMSLERRKGNHKKKPAFLAEECKNPENPEDKSNKFGAKSENVVQKSTNFKEGFKHAESSFEHLDDESHNFDTVSGNFGVKFEHFDEADNFGIGPENVLKKFEDIGKFEILEGDFVNPRDLSDFVAESENVGETSSNFGKGLKNSQNQEEKTVQMLSIQCLNMEKVDKDKNISTEKLEVQHGYVDGSQFNHGRVTIQRIIDSYNQDRREKLKIKLKRNLEMWDIVPEYTKDSKNIEGNDYFVISYSCKSETEPELGKILSREQHTRTSHVYIIFYYGKYQDERSCIMTASTGGAYSVVRNYVDYTFPFKVAERIADPKKITEFARHNLLGDGNRVELMGAPFLKFHTISNPYYLIEYFVCQIKQGSSLSRLFKRKVCSVKFTSSGLLRIKKRLVFDKDCPRVFRLLSKHMNGVATYDLNNQEEVKDSAFEFLHFLRSLPPPYKELNAPLAEAIFYQNQTERKLPFRIRHKYLEDYLSSSEFGIKFDSGPGRFQPIEHAPPEIDDIVKFIKDDDEETFKKNILEGKIRFTDNNKETHEEKIIDYVEGQLLHSSGETYFKVRKVWYQIREESLTLLHKDFKALLKKALIQTDEKGWLPHKWRGTIKRGKITPTILKDKLSLTKNEAAELLSHLKGSRVYFITPENEVMQKKLVGEILKVEVIRKHRVAIEGMLCESVNLSKEKIGLACKEDSEKVWKELKKERRVIVGKEDFYVCNPFPYSLKEKPNYDSLLQLLSELYNLSLTEDEDVYNQSYLGSVNINKGYLVFDKITPENIEPCDILRYTSNTVFLYHVKERFAQHTRDVCSQISNAASRIRDALLMQESHNYLESLWDLCDRKDLKKSKSLWFEEVQDELRFLGKPKFIDIFRNRNIVFVYAYLRKSENSFFFDVEKPYSVTCDDLGGGEKGMKNFEILKRLDYVDSAGCLKNKSYFPIKEDFEREQIVSETDLKLISNALANARSSSNSTLAKIEVVHLAETLRSWGFEFKMCEIQMKEAGD